MTVDVLDNDYGRIDDYPEIDSTQGNQVGGRLSQTHQGESAEERQRYVHGRNQRSANIPKEKHQHQKYQRHSNCQVLEHGVQRGRYQCCAIVERDELVPAGHYAGRVEARDFGLHPSEGFQSVPVLAHQPDALDDLFAMVHAHDAESGGITDIDLSDVIHANRNGPIAGEHDSFDVVEGLDQPAATYVEDLLANRKVTAAHVAVPIG